MNEPNILICAKNEEANILQYLPSILTQNKPTYVVDDFSTDATLSVLNDKQLTYSNLNVIQNPESGKSKKMALLSGLKQINSDSILLTDADCEVFPTWANEMHAALEDKDMVFGYSPYKKEPGLLNRWIRFEAFLTAVQYLGFALRKLPYMGVGRNILYRKSLIRNGDVLKRDLDLVSGDDDLMVNQLADSNNTAIQINKEAWVYSIPAQNWRDYIRQKRRHHTSSTRYKFIHQWLLSLYPFSLICFYVLFFLLCANGNTATAFSLLVGRWILLFPAMNSLFKTLGLADLRYHWWYLDIFTCLYYLFFSVFLLLPQSQKW